MKSLVLGQQHGAVVYKVIASCQDLLKAYWMKAMTQTIGHLPLETYLCNVLTKHFPFCIQCGQVRSQKKSPLHCLSNCPKFHARTAVHNQVCMEVKMELAASLSKDVAAH